MLPKEKRLQLNRQFRWVASGKRLEDRYFKIFYLIGENQLPKVGISLSKSQYKKAVDRNRARRVTSQVFEDLYDRLPKGLNIIIIPKSEVVGVDREVLLGSIKELLQREKII